MRLRPHHLLAIGSPGRAVTAPRRRLCVSRRSKGGPASPPACGRSRTDDVRCHAPAPDRTADLLPLSGWRQRATAAAARMSSRGMAGRRMYSANGPARSQKTTNESADDAAAYFHQLNACCAVGGKIITPATTPRFVFCQLPESASKNCVHGCT